MIIWKNFNSFFIHFLGVAISIDPAFQDEDTTVILISYSHIVKLAT